MDPLKEYKEHQIRFNHQLLRYSLVSVKRMGDIDKITRCKVCREEGSISYITKSHSNEEKLANNLVRAKTTIKEIALCNDFQWFVTLTIDKSKFDRYNLEGYKKSLGKWLNNYQYRRKCKIEYLLIPEFHKDGAVHMHGLISGIPETDLTINEHGYLDWVLYHDKYGYILLSPIKDKIKCANYITKYISKSLIEHSGELNKHLYMCSKGLKRGEVVYRQEAELTVFDYENEYCQIKIINNKKEDYRQYIDDSSCDELLVQRLCD